MNPATTHDDRYKWTALSNTTLGVFMALLDSSIVIISLPAIFRGIHLDPLRPANVGYLLWMLMGYLVATAVLVVTFGRLGDMFGRVKMYNLGFAVFTVATIGLSLTPGTGASAAMFLIIMRVVQGVGGALLMANSTAIITDAFPAAERGKAMGINAVAAMAGSFMGLILGGLLADINWRLVFWVNVPFGVFGTVWAYLKLRDSGERRTAKIDWAGNFAFAGGLIAMLVGITYAIQPYGHHTMAWTRPFVLACLIGGAAGLVLFAWIEQHVAEPMFNLSLFRIRAFAAGNFANLLSAIGRGGLQFILIIWLQGIWLPLHGYSFESTPLWAGIYMIPLTLGMLLAGPTAGVLADRHGPRRYATGGMLIGALSFLLLMTLPANFSYWVFALLLFLGGVGSGVFMAPNTIGMMNSVPPEERGAASGMRATGMNAGMVLSIGLFFSLMIVGLSSTLPSSMERALTAQGVPVAAAQQVAHTPAVGSLFAAFLGYNPMKSLLPAKTLAALPPAKAATITGKQFFPKLMSQPFLRGLRYAFSLSVVIFMIAALASWLRGDQQLPPGAVLDRADEFGSGDLIELEPDQPALR